MLTYFLYREAARKYEVHKAWIVILSALRWTALTIFGLLLINPLIRYVSNKKINPVILILKDETASIKEGMKPQEIEVYQQNMQKLEEDLSRQFKVVSYHFGTGIADSVHPDKPFSQTGTDIEKALYQAEQRNIGEHIGAVILASDGIYNHGINPLYHTSFQGIPLYTIALGDTTAQKDIWIQRLRYNDLVYLGDEVQVLADIAAEHFNGQQVKVQLKNAQNQLIQEVSEKIEGEEWNTTAEFRIKAEQAGIHRYRISVSNLSSEKTHQNNFQDFYIQVIDGRQKITLLYDAPHPDVKFIRDALEQSQNIEVNISQIEEYQSESGLDLLILHGLPSAKNRASQTLLKSALKNSESVWWIASSQVDWPVFNQLQNLVQITNVQHTPNDVRANFHPTYQKFFVSENALNWLDQTPPLVSPYGQYQTAPNAEICWSQQLGKVKTFMPLLVTGEDIQKKTAVLMGEGIWRWAMQEYSIFEQKNRSYEWVERLVQFVANRSDHRPFRIRSGKTIYNESENISIEAALYSESVQMVNPSEVKVILKNEEGFHQEFLMDKTLHAYTYNVGKLPAGTYQILGETELNQKKLKAESKFAVQKFDLEISQSRADYGLMNTLALRHQSSMVHFTEIEKLSEIIREDERIRPIFKEISDTRSLIDFKILLWIAIVLLSLEWFLRRFLGQY